MSKKKIRVLLIAYACEPGKGSEPSVGWNWATQINKFAETWVITRKNNEDSINNFVKESNCDINFVYIDLSKLFLKFKKFLPIWVYYYFWQVKAFFTAKKLNRKINFDLAHHVTFMTIRINFIPFLKIKSIVGPVGGLETLPIGFEKIAGHHLKEMFRKITIKKLKVSWLWKTFINKCDYIIVANPNNKNFVHPKHNSKVIISQIGVTERENIITTLKKTGTINIYWGGILERWKGLELLLKALSKTTGDWHLDITGKGSDEKYFKKLVNRLGLNSKVQFWGWIEKKDQEKLLSGCDIFVFTSLRETTGLILLEAMSYGRPVIALDWGGPSSILKVSTGIKIPVKNVDNTISELSNAIMDLMNNFEKRKNLGDNAYKAVKTKYSWNKKGEEMHKIYQNIFEAN